MTNPEPPTAAEQQFLQYLKEASQQVSRVKELAELQTGKITSLKAALDNGEDVAAIVDELVDYSLALTAQVMATVGSVETPPIIIGLTASVVPANDIAATEPIPNPLPEPPTPPTE